MNTEIRMNTEILMREVEKELRNLMGIIEQDNSFYLAYLQKKESHDKVVSILKEIKKILTTYNRRFGKVHINCVDIYDYSLKEDNGNELYYIELLFSNITYKEDREGITPLLFIRSVKPVDDRWKGKYKIEVYYTDFDNRCLNKLDEKECMVEFRSMSWCDIIDIVQEVFKIKRYKSHTDIKKGIIKKWDMKHIDRLIDKGLLDIRKDKNEKKELIKMIKKSDTDIESTEVDEVFSSIL